MQHNVLCSGNKRRNRNRVVDKEDEDSWRIPRRGQQSCSRVLGTSGNPDRRLARDEA